MTKSFPYYPLFLDVEQREVVIVGGGGVAVRKVETMLKYGARVTVIAPDVAPEIESWAVEGRLALEKRGYAPGDVHQATIVVAATNRPELNRKIAEECRERHILVNVIDAPELCDFIVPAVIEHGSIQVAVSTGGSSPALARRLKHDLQEVFGAEYAEASDLFGSLRKGAQAALPEDRDRKAFFDALLEGGILRLLREGRRREAYEFAARSCDAAGVPRSEFLQQRLTAAG